MGYRNAARMHRRQWVGGHYRTSKKGKVFWVSGHTRNDYGSYRDPEEEFFIGMMIAGFFTLGITWVLLVIHYATKSPKPKSPKSRRRAYLPPGAKEVTERMYELNGKQYFHTGL